MKHVLDKLGLRTRREIAKHLPDDTPGPSPQEAHGGEVSQGRLQEIRKQAEHLLRKILLRRRAELASETEAGLPGRRGPREIARVVLDSWRFRLQAIVEPNWGPLTGREREVAGLAACGLCNKTIAEAIDVSWRTVARHIGNAFAKLRVKSREELLAGGLMGPAEDLGPGKN
ncbi:MAG: helix-turn-helix transcriptional regulator [Planctomycetes bacterium]|nr:helix-turn-helix transcriptional regulator [Planctomycetota bacterium]